ncbi:hypothetical protein Scep_017089 [Stephania cephalantha]|uniref:Uncharacterized protein n=1 Tax=Stephania cephalantha TaxID=152367 RepID=A0AAP0IQP1_9MAGN
MGREDVTCGSKLVVKFVVQVDVAVGDWARQLTVEEPDESGGDMWRAGTRAVVELDADDMWANRLLTRGCAWQAGRINDCQVAATMKIAHIV